MLNQKETQAQLSYDVDRQFIPVGQASERYVLLKLKLPEAARSRERLPLNLSLIIDRSGSMSGQKLEYVKEAAIHVLRLLSEQDRVSLITYDDEVKTVSPSQGVTSRVRQEMIQQIRDVRSGGMTNLSGGWFTGCEQIAQFMNSDYLNRALLLTDGLANRGMTDHEELVFNTKTWRRKGISTTTFGVGQDFNQFLLQGIAENGGGHFYFIDHPQQIPNYFAGELGEMLMTVAREIVSDISVPAGVKIDLLNDVPSELQADNLRIFLNDGYSNEERLFVAKLTLPAMLWGQTLFFSLMLQYEDVEQRKTVTLPTQTMQFTTADDHACANQPVNESVLKEAAQMLTNRAKIEALKLEERRDFAAAQQRLQDAAQALAASMPAQIVAAFIEQLQREAAKIGYGRSKIARRASHYHTYRSQKSRIDYKK